MSFYWKCIDCGHRESERWLMCPNCTSKEDWEREIMRSSGMHLSSLTLNAIDAEYTRAHIKHAGHTPKNSRMSDGERLAILMEEVGEVARAMTYDNGDIGDLIKELIQVAAMAAAHAEYAMMVRDARRNGEKDPSKENAIHTQRTFGPEGSS